MYKRLYSCLLFSLLSVFVCQNASAATTASIFVYEDIIGGPYVDDWYVEGNLANKDKLKLVRDGKSGDLDMPISINCQKASISVVGRGLLYGSDTISIAETQEYITDELLAAVIRKVCF